MKTTLTLAALAALGLAAVQPVQAAVDQFRLDLDHVTFSDGATASGYAFVDVTYDNDTPTDITFSNYDITTTDGVTPLADGSTALGFEYTPADSQAGLGEGGFLFADGPFGPHLLYLAFDFENAQIDPNETQLTLPLIPGSLDADGNFEGGSAEFVLTQVPQQPSLVHSFVSVLPSGIRTVTGGNVIGHFATPEPATAAPFVLGGFALLGLARRKRV